ncbi:MAG TPA: hypothetical protein VMU41_07730 [Candidatus Binataceae bacterium]|nr:hypothetical protein [Candidatus Binataceae bacterium]
MKGGAWTAAAVIAGTVAAYAGGFGTASAVEIRHAGKLDVPLNTPLAVFSTDPTIMNVLSQDIDVARRGAGANTPTPVTITVEVAESPLKPGVTLNQIALGDPDVAQLMKSAGATPPPLGDTGDQVDQAALARAQAESQMGMPNDSPMESALHAIQTEGNFGPSMADPGGCPGGAPCADPNAMASPRAHPGDPGYTGDTQAYMAQGSMPSFFHRSDPGQYVSVVVARASASGSNQEITVVAVVNPGEDVHEAKRLVAEEIANTVLH